MTADTDHRTDAGTESRSTGAEVGPPAGPPVGVVPYLAVRDGRAALAWYAQALGAAELGDRYEDAEGRVGHAALSVHGAVFYLSDEAPELGVEAAAVDASVHTSLVLTVPDVDSATDRAVDAGARLERPPGDNPYGRIAVVRDPFGHRWMLEGPVREPATGGEEPARAGDLGYVTLSTGDPDRAAAFYGAVLGWQVVPGSVPEGRHVTNTTLPTGIWGGRDDRTVRCCWRVDDLDAAIDRVRAAGGSADAPTQQEYGRLCGCTDDQGQAFDLFEPLAGADPEPRTPVNGAHQGDLSYLTIEAADAARTLAFYTAVLGWRSGPDGEPDVHPMLGLADGREPRAVPMWKVDDVAAAVARVRSAGGTADEPEHKPYGISATCTDDQGMPFYLGDA